MDSGSAAEWVAAVATILATGAAVFGGVMAFRAYRREQRREHRSQAVSVHAWLASDSESESVPRHLVLQNASGAPIYKVRVEVVVGGAERPAPSKAGTWHIIPPGMFVVAQTGRFPWGLPRLVEDSERYQPVTLDGKSDIVALQFTDARGVRWRRDRTSDLIELVSASGPGRWCRSRPRW